MKRPLILFLILPWLIALLGMGIMDGGSNGTPARNFSGVLTDRDGTGVTATWIQSGKTLGLSGKIGRGRVDIAFDDILKIEFAGSGQEPLVAHVTMRSGKTIDLSIRDSLAFTGRTDIGAYRIRARDLKTVEFEGE